MSDSRGDAPFARYLALFETLTPDQLDAFDAVTREDMRFADPFSDVTGRDGFKRVLTKMFADVDAPRFTVLHVAGDGPCRYVRWRFEARARGRRAMPIVLEGVSEIHLALDGRITTHIDHWDTGRQVYEQLPVLGWVLRRIRRRIGVSR